MAGRLLELCGGQCAGRAAHAMLVLHDSPRRASICILGGYCASTSSKAYLSDMWALDLVAGQSGASVNEEREPR